MNGNGNRGFANNSLLSRNESPMARSFYTSKTPKPQNPKTPIILILDLLTVIKIK
jgi:hypothetical protein